MPEPIKVIIPSYGSFVKLIADEQRRLNKYASVFCTTFDSDNRVVFYPEDYFTEFERSDAICNQPRTPIMLKRQCERNNIRCISSSDLKSTLTGLNLENRDKIINVIDSEWSVKKEQILLILAMLYIDKLHKNRAYDNKYAITATNGEFADHPFFCATNRTSFELSNITFKKHAAY